MEHGPRGRVSRVWARRTTGWAKIETALEAYDDAISINPADANGFAGRGDVLESLRMPDRAVA